MTEQRRELNRWLIIDAVGGVLYLITRTALQALVVFTLAKWMGII